MQSRITFSYKLQLLYEPLTVSELAQEQKQPDIGAADPWFCGCSTRDLDPTGYPDWHNREGAAPSGDR